MRERKMDKRIQCPVCGKEGVLQWKNTVTKAKGKTYRYKKLYVYHWHPKKPKWCYLRKEHLKILGIIKKNLTQNNYALTQNPLLHKEQITLIQGLLLKITQNIRSLGGLAG